MRSIVMFETGFFYGRANDTITCTIRYFCSYHCYKRSFLLLSPFIKSTQAFLSTQGNGSSQESWEKGPGNSSGIHSIRQ